jgi:uncharacterized repeat protein (TIGR03806 family)
VTPRILLGLLALLVAACTPPQQQAPTYISEGNPALLSEWGMMRSDGARLTLSEGVIPFDLNTPLFSDYAHKQRTIWMPAGTHAQYREGQALDFPVGTVITKTFYYPLGETDNEVRATNEQVEGWRTDGLVLNNLRLMETRILVHRDDGWAALPYVWNAEQTDARLARAGHIQRLTLLSDNQTDQEFAYVVPNANQCAGCHATNNTTRDVLPIGPAARHLNRNYEYASGRANQLQTLVDLGYLNAWPGDVATPETADFLDASSPLAERARDYLDINCAHCHNPVGPADTSGLHLNYDAPADANLGLCKLPIAAGGGTGGRRHTIVPGQPDSSILLYRMEIVDPASLMPELGRSTVHDEGVALISDWILSLDGACE